MIKVQSRESFLEIISSYLVRIDIAVEIGVLNGDFSEMILKYINPAALILVDPFATIDEVKYGEEMGNLPTAYSTEENYNNVVSKLSEQIKSGQVIINRNLSHDAIKDYPDMQFDFIYVDGCHLCECVKRDLSDWSKHLREGGIIAGHDYSEIEGFGVIEAVDKFCNDNNFEMFLINNEGGDWALKRK